MYMLNIVLSSCSMTLALHTLTDEGITFFWNTKNLLPNDTITFQKNRNPFLQVTESTNNMYMLRVKMFITIYLSLEQR